jgi:hypothetical protein
VECGEWADAIRLGVLKERVEVLDVSEECGAECVVFGPDEAGGASAKKTSQSYVAHEVDDNELLA